MLGQRFELRRQSGWSWMLERGIFGDFTDWKELNHNIYATIESQFIINDILFLHIILCTLYYNNYT